MTTAELKLPIPLDQLRRILNDYNVVRASVFGSYARGEQTPESDLDLFIECRSGVSLFDIFDLQNKLEHETGIAVDLVTKISPHFIQYIEPDLIEITS